jgi:dolichyl-phosphate-mannose-protein mannosyltransferase
MGRLTRSTSLTWWLLAGVVALATATRFAGIGAHLGIDDAYSWFAASSPNADVFLDRLADNENTPPLIYLVLMAMPGTSPAWLRVPAAIPGVLICVALFFALRPRLGDRPSLLAALGVAVAPYLITYSNIARGFILSDLALLVSLWCLLSLAERETTGKWVGFFLAGTVAVYSEYRSAIVLIAMSGAAVWLGRPRRRPTLIACGVVLLALAAWIPQIGRAQDQVGVTKFNPLSASPSVTGLRDAFVTLALGESGGTGSSAGRWLLFAGIVALCGASYLVLRGSWAAFDERARRTIQVLAITSVLTLVGYALAGIVGIDVFSERYLTILVPFAAGLAAGTLATLPVRWVVPATAVLLVGLGVGNFERRLGGQWQPDLAPVRAAAEGLHPRTVLTNTPVVLYYLPSLRPEFDRPYNLGRGRAATCPRPCLVIDDTRVHGGTPRGATGDLSQIGPFLLVYER